MLHLQVALEPDVWRWLATQEKDYAMQINAILQAHIYRVSVTVGRDH